MAITMEKLIAAGNDLNGILKLEPPINTIFATELKGGAAKAVEAKFARGLQTEIAQLAEYQDKETGKFDLQPGDLPLLQKETLEVIFEISPKAKERLVPSQEKVAEKKSKEKKPPKQKAEEGKDKYGFPIGSPRNLFVEMIKSAGDKGIRMVDAKKAEWNKDHATFYSPVQKLLELGSIKREGNFFIFNEKD